MRICWGIVLRNHITWLDYGMILQDCIMDVHYRTILRNFIMGSHYGVILRDYITELYYGITLWDYIKELPCGKNLGTSWALPDPLPETPTPIKQTSLYKCTAPEAPDCCIRICLLQRIEPKTQLDCFMMYTMETEPSLVGQGQTGGSQGFERGRTPHEERSLRIYICMYIHQYIICIYMYIYMYIHMAASQKVSGPKNAPCNFGD